jgi:RimJ/RimL family protein N-acetyltransferase
LTAAFETLRLSKVISLPQTDNPPSVRVAERIGMRRERDIVAPATDKRGPVEVAVMAVTRDEWASLSAES